MNNLLPHQLFPCKILCYKKVLHLFLYGLLKGQKNNFLFHYSDKREKVMENSSLFNIIDSFVPRMSEATAFLMIDSFAF